ncbi:MAG: acyl-CoA dehydrogenase family protein [Pseudomonadales bacterium]|nr:acyl-CoA dehydrogenase family protein [Pseudomonadales bacterium]MDP6472539.1 acyl-CoA dehydrogenase family protein [Pseudomonadales bacterium]MDP6829020.1 acyl-CoA dehydrogenase family protein [Pseudomonadales bacterium]MDP6969915.1 acyl-CoA dehydrogenase family protein [Pseudomonadales bacterium]
MSLRGFPEEVRDWLGTNCPPGVRGKRYGYTGGRGARIGDSAFTEWFDRCVERGFTVPTWPLEYGGAGLTAAENDILTRELRAIQAPRPLLGMGVNLIGPTILEFGSQEQKSFHLPRIAEGEIRWCQGYSEPGAGSDLAGLQTRAVSNGNHYTINGSKIWTSGAHVSDWIFCLVRTDSNAPKHEGISFLLMPLDSAGISVRQIDLIAGGSEFCEVFFTDVNVPKSNLLGEENKGWSIAKRLLQYERFSVTEPGASGFSLVVGGVDEIAKSYVGMADGRIQDPVLRNEITRNAMDARSLDLTIQRIKQESADGDAVNVTTSILKYYSSELTCEEDELRIQAMGAASLGWEGPGFSDLELSSTRKWLTNKAARIAGGTSEIQLNIIAKRVLGLPD